MMYREEHTSKKYKQILYGQNTNKSCSNTNEFYLSKYFVFNFKTCIYFLLKINFIKVFSQRGNINQ